MRVSEDQLTNAIVKALLEMDADDFAKIAGDILGGECFFIPSEDFHGGNEDYEFTPNENYMGALDEEENITFEIVERKTCSNTIKFPQ